MNCIIKGCNERALIDLGCCIVHAEYFADLTKENEKYWKSEQLRKTYEVEC